MYSHFYCINPMNSKDNSEARNYMARMRTSKHNQGTTRYWCCVCESETEHVKFDCRVDAIQESALNGRIINGFMIDAKVCVQCDGGKLPC